MLSHLKNHTFSSVIANRSAYNVLIIFSMLYLCFMLCNAILTNRYVGNDDIYVLGGTFTSPFIFILDDMIGEIYGYKIIRNIIFLGYAFQTLFMVICQFIVYAPHPHFFTETYVYQHILGTEFLRIDLSGFLAYITANLINSYLITRWKILVKGKYFLVRSLGSSIFSEALYSIIAILMMEIDAIPLQQIIKIIELSFSIKVIYTICFSIPSSWIVSLLKIKTGMDVFDLPRNLTPHYYFLQVKKELQ